MGRLLVGTVAAFVLVASGAAGDVAGGPTEGEAEAEEHPTEDSDGEAHHSPRLSDEAIPLQLEGFPERPKPLLELGEPFLGTGTLDRGFQLPTGAVWQPSFLVFGTFRTAIQSFEPATGPTDRITEWANRLDLFANLALSGTERLVVGIRALDEDGRFTGVAFEHPDPDVEGSFEDVFSAEIDTLFFEGDFGEIFPNLDREDVGTTDVGFSIGRQSMLFQGGMLIGDTIDGIGLTRNTVQPRGTSNFRATLFYGWGDLNLDRATERRGGEMLALLTSTDTRRSTVDVDVAWVRSDDEAGDLLAGGVTAVQRIGRFATTVRLLASSALDDETAFSTDGTLLFGEASWVPRGTHDHAYVTAFAALDAYTPAARSAGSAADGPLGPAGIAFASVDLGRAGAPLSSAARDVVGGAFGYQRFLAHTRQQLLLEAAVRVGLDDEVGDDWALVARYQAALKRRFVVVLDAFAAERGGVDASPWGGRVELVVKF